MRAIAEVIAGAALAGCLLRLILLVGPVLGGHALRRVRRQIRHNTVVFRPAQPRPWWKFW